MPTSSPADNAQNERVKNEGKVMRIFVVALLSILCLGISPADAQDWTAYGGDRGASKYSSLKQINRDNVDKLELAWSYRTGEGEGPMAPFGGSFGFGATPILLPDEAGGALVLCSPFDRLIALDPVTGEERWSYDPEVKRGVPGIQYKCRGVAQWRDTLVDAQAACAWRIVLVAVDQRIIVLDARTGELCDGFGEGGVVDLVPLIDQTLPATDTPGVHTYMPPVIVSDTVIFGSSVGSKFREVNAPSGAVHGLDARTGEHKWSFDPVPRNEGDPEAVNWTPDALTVTGGGNVWTLMSVDVERDLVFLPTSSPSPNYYGGTRPGDNRYSNSLVTLRGSTGEIVWHYQIVHHDVWDWDLASQPMLVDITRGDEVIPAVVQLTKHGFVFVFNRETGDPLFEIKERPVPTDGVPGDELSPTQPFPTAPPPLTKLGVEPDDAWGFTFYDRAACRRIIESYRHGEIFTPPTTEGTVFMPGMVSNYGAGAFDPARNLLITNPQQFPLFIRLWPKEDVDPEDANSRLAGIPGGPPGPIDGTPYAIERGQPQVFSPFGAPCTEPPWYSLTAVDLAEGTIKWSVPLGTIETLAPFPLPFKMGAPGMGGPIVTAGGLIFIGATADEKFRSFDIETGEELWAVKVPTAAMATPMTYEVDGRQFVVVAAGGHHAYYRQKVSDYLLAFALPEQ